ncbi:hypothetical protein AMK59_2716 [Oryctes borbonicus]|uniref:tRNA (uracil-O(2)-)-methyltransferase n=1 Tax=Oryctes borbonicus TaxID=1629725 RepID=A0A0T6BE59_9SCAR|nr:hypothetical protein AMK59_2716 [Oryctes borbonicus]
MKIPLITSGCTVPLDKFWLSTLVYHDRPNLLNKKISGITQLYFYEVDLSNINNITQLFTYSAIIYEVRKLSELTRDTLRNLILDILQPHDKNLKLKDVDRTCFNSVNNKKIFISLRILIPRNASSKKCVEIAILNKKAHKITFIAVEEEKNNLIAPPFPYHFEWITSGHVRITVDNFEDADTPNAEWLVGKVFPKIINWTLNEPDQKSQLSLSLIPLERYCELYQKLKAKYGKAMTEIWPENTDPLKFVYEDVAIASYLICLWETTNTIQKPTFVDLGCGNGLLVYILSQEGYCGYGIDVRKRKVWDIYPSTTKLLVKTIIPSAASLFPDIDWIIGNHSDELTPWIPVISMRSSHKTNFFLLPCCSFDFSGAKYARVNTSKSQYLDYLDYVQDICRTCEFTTRMDKLRIPSTKNICIVSFGRTYEEDEFEVINERATRFIENRTGTTNRINEVWVQDFKPREKVEKVQNCTQLNRDLIRRILKQVVTKLLESKVVLSGDDGSWNRGGEISFNEIISSIDKNDLKQLKSNCGGLQTLLRNHRYIFEVANGSVKIRVPKKLTELAKYKDKPCWFLKNHPDGCPNSSEQCAYNHEQH